MATHRICVIHGCGKRRLARGFCSAHYMRFQRHGEPLGGGISKGEAQRFYREVVLPYDGTECLTWPYDCSSSGYGRIHYDGKQRNVSRIVCEAASGPPPTAKHQAAHSCGNGHLACVAKTHISWKTPIDNAADKIGHGTTSHGEGNGSAKLTVAHVERIRALRGSLTQRAIAEQFGVTPGLVSQIFLRKIWK